MQHIILAVSVVILIIGGFIQQQNQRIEQTEPAASSPTPTPIASSSATPTPTPTNKSLSTPSAKPTTTNAPSIDLQLFRYTNATVISMGNNTLQLTSNDDADVITNWYKNTITSNGFRSTAFAATKTNGNVLTKLAGSKQGIKIQIEITKPADQSTTTILVSLNPY